MNTPDLVEVTSVRPFLSKLLECYMKSLKSLGILSAALLVASAAQATPVLLDTIIHDYGNVGSQVAPTGLGGSDVVNANSVTVRSSALSGGRFSDQFGLGSVVGIIDSFKLTMNFTGAQNEAPLFGFFGPPTERWAPKPASSGSNGSLDSIAFLDPVGPQSWVFDNTLDVFNDILASGSFYLWMAREIPGGVRSVDLDYARLEVYGTPEAVNSVPNPGSLPLVAAAFGALFLSGSLKGAVRRAKDNHKTQKLAALGRSYSPMNFSAA